jgi:hypothetical protein
LAYHLEKSAKTVADHERLVAYYRSKAEQAQESLDDAEDLLKKWGPIEKASKRGYSPSVSDGRGTLFDTYS